MAEKDTKEVKKVTHSVGGEMGLGTIMLLLILGVFILWILTGSQRTNNSNNYFVPAQQIDKNFPN